MDTDAHEVTLPWRQCVDDRCACLPEDGAAGGQEGVVLPAPRDLGRGHSVCVALELDWRATRHHHGPAIVKSTFPRMQLIRYFIVLSQANSVSSLDCSLCA